MTQPMSRTVDRDRGLAVRDADAVAESAVVPFELNVVPVAGLVDADRRPHTVHPGRDHLERSRIPRLFVKEDATATAVEAVDYVTNNSATIIGRFAFVVQTIKGDATKPDVTSTLAMAVQGSGIDDAAAVAFLDDPVLNAPAAAARVTVGRPAVRLLNWMEHETATFAVLGRSTEAVKIGTEFTFADKPGTVDSVRKLDIIDSAKRDATQKRVHKKASDTITAWVGKALTGRNLISGNPSIKVAAAKGSGSRRSTPNPSRIPSRPEHQRNGPGTGWPTSTWPATRRRPSPPASNRCAVSPSRTSSTNTSSVSQRRSA